MHLRPALGGAEQGSALGAHRIKDGEEILAPFLKGGKGIERKRIGQSGPALLEEDEAENEARRSRNRTASGSSHNTCRWLRNEGTCTRSIGPEPTTWYAMWTPLRVFAYRTSGGKHH